MANRRPALDRHTQFMLIGATKIDFSRAGLDLGVGRCTHRHFGPLNSAQIALAFHRLIADARVGRIVINNAINHDSRRNLNVDPIAVRSTIARHKTVRDILLHAEIAGRKSAFMPVVALRLRKRNALIHCLAIGRAVDQLRRIVFVQACDFGRHRHGFTVKRGSIARLNVEDHDARRRGNVRPRQKNSRRRANRVLRRNDQVQTESGQHNRQHNPHADDMRSIDGYIDFDVGQIVGRPTFHRLINRHCHFLTPTAKQQEIDQAVLQRWLAAFDRGSGKDGVDPTHKRRQHAPGEIRPRDADQRRPQPQPPAKAQPALDQPMIDHRRNQQVSQNADGQRNQPLGDIYPFDMPLCLTQSLLDHDLALGQRHDRRFGNRQWRYNGTA